MSAFTPTLVLAADQSEIAEMAAEGLTPEMVRAQIISFYTSKPLSPPRVFRAKTVIVAETQGTEDEVILNEFFGVVAARYTIGGSFFLKFATGDVMEIDFITI